jgi:dihydropteroate synthase
MGVLNVTPDSFSDGGRFPDREGAVAAGLAMARDGADWIDVGGESTRPGAAAVPAEVEQARVLPVISALAQALAGREAPVWLSIDTYKASTAKAALAAGARIVNDVSGGLADPGILEVAAEADAVIVLGHLRGTLATMMQDVSFADVVAEVGDELASRVDAAKHAGCQRIWVDPGIGFGKGTAENLALIAGLPRLRARVGVPVLMGVSRKRFLGELTGRPVDQRAFGTAAAVAACVLGGAAGVRVHDVAAMRDVLRVADALSATGRERD